MAAETRRKIQAVLLIAILIGAEARSIHQNILLRTSPLFQAVSSTSNDGSTDAKSGGQNLIEDMMADPKLQEQAKDFAKQMQAMMSNPDLQDQTKLFAKQMEEMKANPNLQDQMRLFAKQMEGMKADPNLQEQAKLFAKKMEEMTTDPKLQEQSKHFAKQMESMMANVQTQANEMKAVMDTPEFQEKSKLAAHDIDTMVNDSRFQSLFKKMDMVMKAGEEQVKAKSADQDFQEQVKDVTKEIEMMMEDQKLQQQAEHFAQQMETMMASMDLKVRSNMQSSGDDFLHKMFNRAKKESPLHKEELDTATLGKPNHPLNQKVAQKKAADSGDDMVEMLINKLFDEGVKMPHLHEAELDSTTLGKPGQTMKADKRDFSSDLVDAYADKFFDQWITASPLHQEELNDMALGKPGQLRPPTSRMVARSAFPMRSSPVSRIASGALNYHNPLTRNQLRTTPLMQQVRPPISRGPVPVHAADAIPDPQDVPGFKAKRLLVFAFIVVGYSCYYITRNSLYFTAPVMVDQGIVKDITSIGVITTVFPLFYGCSKFVSGVVGDRLSPRAMLALGLFMTGLMNVAFGCSSSIAFFCAAWGANGILQGFGGPCCAKMITSWFDTKIRGTFWGLWNIAHNMGATAAPLIAGNAARTFGWRYGMFVPGGIGIIVAALVYAIVRDSPESIGYPPVEEPVKKVVKDGKEVEGPSMLENLRTKVLTNWRVLCLAVSFLFVYLVRQGLTSWLVFYLIAEKGAENAAVSAARITGLELGGFVGSLLAGRLSDYLISTAKPGQGHVGRRIQVARGYMLGVAGALAALWYTPVASWQLQWIAIFFAGFFLYGPQMLIGLMGAEVVGVDSVGASEGFLGWVAYMGAAAAGLPLSLLVKELGWQVFFQVLIGTCFIGFLFMSTLSNAKSNAQIVAEEKEKGEGDSKGTR
eukprot:gnl/MRDRNA2_/MRDRNA2_27936_c0_seq1.p1 gnl/MRDRNA2_/MRDRNA2_27936_c0~~gnl/MRDRNA2_/MRDRNA2_27936_c0_seq1.p1  ORF type:complete len:925 (+),score=216.79 gnl/MRDRNA2_/MRDRNA2_27936_c0_seq1:105-2879(+)